MNEVLNFDYTKHSPVAYVPVVLCKGIGCSEHCKERLGGGLGFVPPTHRLQATVSMTLPESEYNRNLGIFQVPLILAFLSTMCRINKAIDLHCLNLLGI